MDGREDLIAREAEALWREVFGEPPSVKADGSTMLDIIMRSTEPRSYERLNRPHLREGALVFPRAAATGG